MTRTTGLALAALALWAAGCADNNEDEWTSDRPQTHPVSGVVRLDGEPLEGATVTFHSTSANKAAAGRTDDEGRFTLTTFESEDGAVAGQHRVTIAKYTEADPPPGYDPETSPPPPGPQLVTPPEYASPQTSGLTETVTAEGENEFEFELE